MLNSVQWVITQQDIDAYAQASGDFNPIHTNEAYAKKAGLPGCIAHGMLVMAAGGAAIQAWYPERLASYEARFQAMTYPDEPLVITGRRENENEGRLTVANEQGEVKLKGVFTLRPDS